MMLSPKHPSIDYGGNGDSIRSLFIYDKEEDDDELLHEAAGIRSSATQSANNSSSQ